MNNSFKFAKLGSSKNATISVINSPNILLNDSSPLTNFGINTSFRFFHVSLCKNVTIPAKAATVPKVLSILPVLPLRLSNLVLRKPRPLLRGEPSPRNSLNLSSRSFSLLF